MQEPSARTKSQVQCACHARAGVKSGFVARGLVGALPVAKLAAVRGCVIEWKPCSQTNSASNVTSPAVGLNIPAGKMLFPTLSVPPFPLAKGRSTGQGWTARTPEQPRAFGRANVRVGAAVGRRGIGVVLRVGLKHQS